MKLPETKTNHSFDYKMRGLSRTIAMIFSSINSPDSDIVQIISSKEMNDTSIHQRTILVQFSMSVSHAILTMLQGSTGIYSDTFVESLSQYTDTVQLSSATVTRGKFVIQSFLQPQQNSKSD